ncbi:rhombosortase [Microbulbifer bruguierae]|uniref:Rhombosortase n=1 Tax=Microbulbifer bruguierae TaxID=3029061 RepID=A0ABY8NA35_9GAMM|nr:rhombosortase [Microbulbifer bruguierae]WGL15335.1 rhombosortase [Microbulbifer bruguierae]
MSRLRGITGPLTLALLSAIALLFAPQLEPLLRYDRTLVDHGELWRLLSGHITHTNLHHWALNLAGLALLWILHRQHYRAVTFLAVTVATALWTGVSLHLFSPHIDLYLGLSGVLHGLIIWGGCLDIRARWRSGYLLVAGTWLKVGWEQVCGASAATARLIDAQVALDAHLWGAVAGSLLGAIVLATISPRPKKRSAAAPQQVAADRSGIGNQP